MNHKLFPAMTVSVCLLLQASGALAGQEKAQKAPEPAADCLGQLEQLRSQPVKGELSEAAREEVQQLHDSARILAKRGDEEGCKSLAATISGIIASDESYVASPEASEALRDAPRLEEHLEVIRASSLLGATVRNTDSEELGTIKNAVVDVKTGKVGYVVLAFGGLIGLGEEMVPVPLDALRIVNAGNTEEMFFVLPVSVEFLRERTPLDDAADWPVTMTEADAWSAAAEASDQTRD